MSFWTHLWSWHEEPCGQAGQPASVPHSYPRGTNVWFWATLHWQELLPSAQSGLQLPGLSFVPGAPLEVRHTSLSWHCRSEVHPVWTHR